MGGNDNKCVDELIHLRVIKFGMDHPRGFMYSEIKGSFKENSNDWAIVDEFLNEAWNNKYGNSARITPYVLLERLGNGNADQCKYTLSFEAYFSYLQYQNRKALVSGQ